MYRHSTITYSPHLRQAFGLGLMNQTCPGVKAVYRQAMAALELPHISLPEVANKHHFDPVLVDFLQTNQVDLIVLRDMIDSANRVLCLIDRASPETQKMKRCSLHLSCFSARSKSPVHTLLVTCQATSGRITNLALQSKWSVASSGPNVYVNYCRDCGQHWFDDAASKHTATCLTDDRARNPMAGILYDEGYGDAINGRDQRPNMGQQYEAGYNEGWAHRRR